MYGNKYHESKIYMLRSRYTHKCYIGSTIGSLSDRLSEHISTYKKYITNNNNGSYCASFEIIKYPQVVMDCLEYYPCENEDQLLEREQEYQNAYINNVNQIAACKKNQVDKNLIIKMIKKAYKNIKG